MMSEGKEEETGSENEENTRVPAINYEIEIGCSSKNDVHGQDYFEKIESKDKLLKGVVVCDGVSSTQGNVASEIIAKKIKEFFLEFIHNKENPKALQIFLDSKINEIPRYIKEKLEEANENNTPRQAASTLLIGLTDGDYLYIYYLGDGYIYHIVDPDRFNTFGRYLIRQSIGNRLIGHLSSDKVSSEPIFMMIKLFPDTINYLIVATDGAKLEVKEQELGLLWKLLVDAKDKKTLDEVVKEYLYTQKFSDDATLAILMIKREPRPLTESITRLPESLQITIDKKIEQILHLFESHSFKVIKVLTKELMNQVTDHRIEVYHLISEGYYNWTLFDHENALTKFEATLRKIEQYHFKMDTNGKKRFDENVMILKKIVNYKKKFKTDSELLKDADATLHLILDILYACERAQKTGLYDIPMLLVYRALEALVQHFLLKMDLDPENPNYDTFSKNFGITKQELEEKVNKIITEKVKGRMGRGSINLPPTVSLFIGLVILHIVDKKFTESLDLNGIYSVLQPWNKSILIHGIRPLSFKIAAKSIEILKGIVKQMLFKLKDDWEVIYEKFKFPKGNIRIFA